MDRAHGMRGHDSDFGPETGPTSRSACKLYLQVSMAKAGCVATFRSSFTLPSHSGHLDSPIQGYCR